MICHMSGRISKSINCNLLIRFDFYRGIFRQSGSGMRWTACKPGNLITYPQIYPQFVGMLLDGIASNGLYKAIMQLKLGIKDATPPTPNNSAAQYSIFALCNKCGGTHNMGVSVILKDGPVEKQSIGNVYEDRNLPESLAKLSGMSTTCPATGRGSTQKDNHQIFLVPAKN